MPTRLKIGVVAAALSQDARQAVEQSRLLGFAGVEFDAYSPRLSLPDLSGSGRRESRSEEHASELQSHRDLVCRRPPEQKNGADEQINCASAFRFRHE